MDEVFDFVVVGSGGGSMCAALLLRKAGKSVLILEKTDLVGGSTARAGGVMWVPNNPFMANAGIADSIDQAARYLDSVVGDHEDTPGATRDRRMTYLTKAPEMIGFLVDQGIKLLRVPYWPDYYDERPGGSEAGRTVMAELFNVRELGPWAKKLRPNNIPIAARMEDFFLIQLYKTSWKGKAQMLRTGVKLAFAKAIGKQLVPAGAALQGRMLQASLKVGTEIRLNSAVQQVILEDDRVIGVLTQKDGKPWRVGARLGVLLNAGGFSHNQEMRDRYIPNTSTQWTHAAPGDTGDMHREMMRIGAAMAQMEEMVGNQMTLPPGMGPQGIQTQLSKPHAFLVDQSGQRYLNEGGSYMEFCKKMLERHRTVPAIPSWMIVDTQFLKKYMVAGTMAGTGNKPRNWTETGYMKKGKTIAALASACGVPPAALEASVARFNASARRGAHDEFGRGERAYDRFLGDFTHQPSSTLGTVERGPFYAFPIVPGDVGTFGGVVTDASARVLREDGSVIHGLYATGTTTASVMGRAYPGAGCSIGPSFTWGYVAAQHAARSNAPASLSVA